MTKCVFKHVRIAYEYFCPSRSRGKNESRRRLKNCFFPSSSFSLRVELIADRVLCARANIREQQVLHSPLFSRIATASGNKIREIFVEYCRARRLRSILHRWIPTVGWKVSMLMSGEKKSGWKAARKIRNDALNMKTLLADLSDWLDVWYFI